MLHSPLAFYRGATAVMAADLASTPVTGLRVQACGDCHLLNFGLFSMPDNRVVFDLNHYDETLPGPWEWDVKRLATSIVLAGRHAHLRDTHARDAAVAATRSYRRQMWRYAGLGPLNVWYDSIDMQRVIQLAPSTRARQRRETLEQRARRWIVDHVFPKLAKRIDGRYRIVDQPPLVFHGEEPGWLDRVQEFLTIYRGSLRNDRRMLFDRYHLHDAAATVVGVGSVGAECFVALLVSDNGRALMLQVKEANTAAFHPHVGVGSGHEGERVIAGQRMMQAAHDLLLGWGTGPAAVEFYVRHLRAMKLSLPMIDVTEPSRLTAYAEFCGWALARAHANSGDAHAIARYLGRGPGIETAIGEFAVTYADQTERDYATLVRAATEGRIEALVED
jgi:hypothetical protein